MKRADILFKGLVVNVVNPEQVTSELVFVRCLIYQ